MSMDLSSRYFFFFIFLVSIYSVCVAVSWNVLVFLLHLSRNMNKIYGFLGEIKHKYDDKVMSLFSKVFQALPLCAVIENNVFVVHGGLSTENGGAVSLEEINKISRFREPPESGLMSDLLWSGRLPDIFLISVVLILSLSSFNRSAASNGSITF
jgi:diadenosine tetraphosphatase ApaH/serine/threonine PP2A family protein phosphatase